MHSQSRIEPRQLGIDERPVGQQQIVQDRRQHRKQCDLPHGDERGGKPCAAALPTKGGGSSEHHGGRDERHDQIAPAHAHGARRIEAGNDGGHGAEEMKAQALLGGPHVRSIARAGEERRKPCVALPTMVARALTGGPHCHPGIQKAYHGLEEEFALVTEIIKARAAAELTQQELAKRMRTTQGAIARLESGTTLPSTRTLKRFAKATGHKLKIRLEPINA